MSEGKIFEVSSMAQAAKTEADKALNAINTHEKICAERYRNITDTMAAMNTAINSMQTNFVSSQATMQISINNLASTKNALMGGIAVIKYSALILTILALVTAVHTTVVDYIAPKEKPAQIVKE
jgi:hypothetical protein